MEKIREILCIVIKMLRQSLKYSQADWLEQRLHEMHTNEVGIAAVREVRSVLAGAGSLSDVYLEVSILTESDERRLNATYRSLIAELDSQVTVYLKGMS